MSSFWESKYLSSEKSIQFLQATHSEILRGLHDEIENLQKQCSDYALRLSMRAATALEKGIKNALSFGNFFLFFSF